MFRFLRILLVLVVLYLGSAFVFQHLYPVPVPDARSDSTAIPASDATRLGRAVMPAAAAQPGRSGVARLEDGITAFAARMAMADAADASIDARYYIWQRDATGLLLLDALQRAAARGVRVRLLLDDNGVPDIGSELAELDAHPNLEVRLFNPFVLRRPRMLSYALDFRRVNRRMHNKSFTVDGVATVVGGRNIGDNYFSQDPDTNYFDMDVVALGPAAEAVSADFDRYWASPSSVPASLLLPGRAADGGVIAAGLAGVRAAPEAAEFERTLTGLRLIEQVMDGTRGFDWVAARLVSDDPSKGQGPVPEEALLTTRLLSILPEVKREVLLVSAYFVPGDRLTGILTGWARRGLDVQVLTNAQEATDVLPVHAGYRKYRGDLVAAGVKVYELKSRQQRRDLAEQFGLIGSTNSSLHAKTFVIDRSQIFVGSFNFDPRSAQLNTEMGLLIDSPALAAYVARGFDHGLKRRAYLVERAGSSGLRWRETDDSGAIVVHDTEPGTTALSRILVRVIGWLPIEALL
ncbi:MAG: phospholipase D family protein [Jhaorihella sp.]